MKIRAANSRDISQLTLLEKEYNQDELSTSAMANNMQGQSFSRDDLALLIDKEYLWVAEEQNAIVAYVIAGSWSFFERWPIYQVLLKQVKQLDLNSVTLTKNNSCQYGPIWIHPDHRGQGLFEGLVQQLKDQIANQYPYMLTFISEDNERSFAAHTQKSSMKVIDFFSFEDRDYYLLLSHTKD
ncbi:GNAT family N-acetyltransferase [Shewanella surugensis]|uniref:GNAT family N-acetyltransferase n=1 Tax=Shewanella surugensis TaxID=212020 RepID=A0ABT0L5G7_9GAMM|nr:GNAT family N-acetyltransferase [Shewanella surugensis]MCL1122923.1 GNAT family N-acetyltransferase [Shewanella surugensis]